MTNFKPDFYAYSATKYNMKFSSQTYACVVSIYSLEKEFLAEWSKCVIVGK